MSYDCIKFSLIATGYQAKKVIARNSGLKEGTYKIFPAMSFILTILKQKEN
jgi:hypothetical protein